MSIQTIAWDETPPADCRGGAVAVGNFNGVHRGHLALLAELRKQADVLKGPAVAVTFDPHPLQLLRPEKFLPVLTTVAERARLLAANGADHVVILRTTRELLQLPAREFFDQVIRRGFGVRTVAEGVNFGFGRNREGNVETLKTLCSQAGIGLNIVQPFLQNGVHVSSSRVRSALMRGTVGEATNLLGRPYRLSGVVGTGQRRGQTLGFPTANLEQMGTLVPGDGVYAVDVHGEPGHGEPGHGEPGGVGRRMNWPGAANIGPNPTFGEQARKVEVHVIGFQGDLYGQKLAVDFIERLRDTRPFAGPKELMDQLQKDVEEARRLILRD